MTDAADPAPRAATVTVWSDIGCPWATLALHTLQQVAKARDDQVVVDHHAFPLELFNRRGTPKGILDAEIVAIAGLVPGLGWRLWGADLSTYPVTTLPALEAVQAAKDPAIGGLAASAQLDAELRRALYVQSRCISLHSVILEVAEDCDLVDHGKLATAIAAGAGRSAVYADWRRARSEGVRGSPQLIARSLSIHNPGAAYAWSAPPGRGFPRMECYDTAWAGELLDAAGGYTG